MYQRANAYKRVKLHGNVGMCRILFKLFLTNVDNSLPYNCLEKNMYSNHHQTTTPYIALV